MAGKKCRNCGSTSIEVDTSRGDAVCTNCGTVAEDNIIVAEVQFEENAHGSASALGQFVSAESKGGATGYGASFHVGIGTESREITLRRARQGITQLCQQLRLNNHCIDTACNFFKMALVRQLTRGRTSTHVHAACVYITCRTEGTAHLLIDISDVLQICCYELGRIYLKLSQSLHINIPSIDPCLYILRFANKLDFGAKTHEVSMTALRLVQRMKRDCIHSGRRPSGLCGAALLIAARMHDFNRVPTDIIRIVKVHETTLRKRLMEFGETPSSALTLDEFMTVDLDAEQDPPAFKAARRKDKERLAKLQEQGTAEFTELQREIDRQLENDLTKSRKRKSIAKRIDDSSAEILDTEGFINESTMDTIQQLLKTSHVVNTEVELPKGLGPDIAQICSAPIIDNLQESVTNADKNLEKEDDFNFDDIDDDEIATYIMTPAEAKSKDELWTKINATFLKEEKIKKEKLEKEKEEGKPEKKKRRTTKKKIIGPSNTAAEAIEKMLQEKKISNKINYDILRSLTSSTLVSKTSNTPETEKQRAVETVTKLPPPVFVDHPPTYTKRSVNKSTSKPNLPMREKKLVGLPVVEEKVPDVPDVPDAPDAPDAPDVPEVPEAPDAPEPTPVEEPEQELEEDYYEPEQEASKSEFTSLASMLYTEAGGDDDYYGYDDY